MPFIKGYARKLHSPVFLYYLTVISENTPTNPTYLPCHSELLPCYSENSPPLSFHHYTVVTGLSRNPLPLDETLSYSQPPPFNYGVIVNSEEVGTLGYIKPPSDEYSLAKGIPHPREPLFY